MYRMYVVMTLIKFFLFIVVTLDYFDLN